MIELLILTPKNEFIIGIENPGILNLFPISCEKISPFSESYLSCNLSIDVSIIILHFSSEL